MYGQRCFKEVGIEVGIFENNCMFQLFVTVLDASLRGPQAIFMFQKGERYLTHHFIQKKSDPARGVSQNEENIRY